MRQFESCKIVDWRMKRMVRKDQRRIVNLLFRIQVWIDSQTLDWTVDWEQNDGLATRYFYMRCLVEVKLIAKTSSRISLKEFPILMSHWSNVVEIVDCRSELLSVTNDFGFGFFLLKARDGIRNVLLHNLVGCAGRKPLSSCYHVEWVRQSTSRSLTMSMRATRSRTRLSRSAVMMLKRPSDQWVMRCVAKPSTRSRQRPNNNRKQLHCDGSIDISVHLAISSGELAG